MFGAEQGRVTPSRRGRGGRGLAKSRISEIWAKVWQSTALLAEFKDISNSHANQSRQRTPRRLRSFVMSHNATTSERKLVI
ncbi:hypothetical protein CY34DRAFT_806581 [Suillus luteus UH-Slu-Lm8-n1]|uniref:Uncharacterized protein n=1 Tax=Suillus luteus UH-Slu-Lm8-n1 TaxID=930992 RepID=A0A0D0ASK1_9AGAM|nr:hypothetical protein CY34DRAFT_806581 [Suillus luteus UH-Slu-Lm8-n1]